MRLPILDDREGTTQQVIHADLDSPLNDEEPKRNYWVTQKMDRIAKLTNHINKEGLGLEIGPGPQPITPKSQGYNVHIVDYMTQEALQAKFGVHDLAIEKIEEVDFIWQGESYAELTGTKNHYDWVVASHVVEHTPDLIGFLIDCDEVLKDDGVLSLAVPDKRYCMDYFRPLTGLGQVIDAHIQKRTVHTKGSTAEYFLNIVSKGDVTAWHEAHQGDYAFVHSRQEMEVAFSQIEDPTVYLDLHGWCFTPTSFRLIMQDLYNLGYIQLREVAFYNTAGCEFMIMLSRSGSGFQQNRLDSLKAIEDELCYPASHAASMKKLNNQPMSRLVQRISHKLRAIVS